MTKIIGMIYSLKDYQKKFHPNRSLRTIQRMANKGLLPENHSLIKVSYFVLVEIDHGCNYEPYIRAVKDYCQKKKMPVDLKLSTECGISNNVSSLKLLNEILGYK